MRAVEDLQETLESMIAGGVSPLEIVVIEESPDYPGELVFQVFEGEQVFYTRYQAWVSCYCVLSELFNLAAFVNQLEQDGWRVVFGPSTERILKDYERWSAPLVVEGYTLHPFQQFSLQRAAETDFWFFNWATGAGKSFVCVAGAKAMLAEDTDVVIACTLTSSKIDLLRFFQGAGLDAVINDGTKPKREKGYAARHQVYVMNYDKLRVDEKAIHELVTGRNVLWIFDECHRLVTADKQNQSRQAFERLNKVCGFHSRIWPMSASVVNGNPLRFRDVFQLGAGRKIGELGTKSEFEQRYADKITVVEIKTASGKRFPLVNYDWNLGRLQEVRHRVGARTQTARKTDPGLAPMFKGLVTLLEPVQMNKDEFELSEAIIDTAWDAYQRGESMGPYYSMLRYICNTPLALRVTDHELGQELATSFDLDKIVNSKLDKLNEKLESIRESGDQVLVFTHWTNLTLHLIKDALTVPYVLHYGVGQTEEQSQEAKDHFKANPDITCFFTSDAGSHGINMQNARYVIQYDPTYSYDDGMQRASRIDRADSHLDGLTNYVMVTENSVEERVWDIQNARRLISAAVQGTAETLSHGMLTEAERERAQRTEQQNLSWLVFGDRA